MPSSIFAWGLKDDYYGGYDFGKDAGTAWVGNHHVSSAKYWTDGNNEAGVRIWKKHTDNDGRNNELMVGFYSDNQPDYSWLQPYESKSGKMVWFPVRELEGLKYANRNGALNLEVTKEQTIKIRMNATSPHKMAVVVLKAKGQVLLEKTINISPAEPFKIDVPLPSGIQKLDLEVALKDVQGQNLLYYKPAEHQTKYPRPEPMKALYPPEKMKSVEECYLAGLRLHQFFNGGLDPMPYYEEGLKRDPGDSRINTQLGILRIKDFNWEEAERYLQIAVDRATSNYTKPKDGESLYYMGIVLRAQGKLDEAYDYFYRSSWSYAWYAASFFQLAEIDCLKGNFPEAIDDIDRSLTTISDNIKALNLKAIILRKMQKLDEAKGQIGKNMDNYKIDHQALYEMYLLDSETGNTKEASAYLEQLTTLMREDVQSYLELATDYSNCGCYQEAVSLLAGLEKRGNNFPMVYYYLGYYWSKIGDEKKALSYYQKASKMPIDYCFPYRAEEVDILKHAMLLNPIDSLAPYYLGNLLYEHQPEQAISAWEKSRELDDSFYIVHRNLGLAYKEVRKDYKEAIKSMEKALECNGEDSRLIFEMDILNELNKVSPQEKCEFLKKNIETVKKRDETLIRLAKRLVEDGQYDEALHILTTNTIIGEFEGVVEMQNAFIDAYTLRGLEYFKKGEFDKALEDIESALAYPIRLIGRARHAQFFYIMSTIYKEIGDQVKADDLLQKTLNINIEPDGAYREFLYYKGLVLKELDKDGEAKQLFLDMLNGAQSKKEDRSIFFTIFEAAQTNEEKVIMNHYLAGLAYQGLGEKDKAKTEFSMVLELNPGHIWGKVHLGSL